MYPNSFTLAEGVEQVSESKLRVEVLVLTCKYVKQNDH